ncbi:Fe-S protein assembly co-chaperone HscB [Tuwongella immobilis]|uniref:Fe-S protein assembly co-chaperone HscB n=1 Tax=Tuwongella immobilis TaxID=692036 RepID=UPI0021BC66F3|nr:Fe-S protein assembly co-chaperone HscB [Tuwongella immobilis]
MVDHFDRLGFPRRFDLDIHAIEQAYLARSREVHPDYFSDAASADQLASLDLASKLNESIAILREPFRRAEHLLELLGGPSASEMKQMSPEFLEEMLELRMAIEEIRDAQPRDFAAIDHLEQSLQQRQSDAFEQIAQHFAEIERMPPEASNRILHMKMIREQLNAVKYLQGLLRDLLSD